MLDLRGGCGQHLDGRLQRPQPVRAAADQPCRPAGGADRAAADRSTRSPKEGTRPVPLLAGGRPIVRSARAANELTPGERRVVELAARGRSNRQIANDLFVTVKAVEWHLANSYRKLGITGRTELPGAVTPC